jgi:protein-disulfide isomerase
MICIFAFFVFVFLAIFSAAYRPLAKEAFECVFRRITLRPCETALDQRIKAHIIGKIMKRSHKLAAFTFRYFEVLSWILVILTVASLAYTVYGGYNYYRYGNCYGPESTAFCPFGAFDETTSGIQSDYTGPFIAPTADDDPSKGPEDAKITIIEFGCYMCPYTQEAEPIIKQVLKKYEGKVRFIYRDFPVGALHAGADLHAEAANCAGDQNKYWEYHDKLLSTGATCGSSEQSITYLKDIAKQLNLDEKKFSECLDTRKYQSEIQKDFEDGIKAKLTGTPTFFINQHTIVGPRPVAAFEKVIDEELAK